MCDVLMVFRSGFYAWRQRSISSQELRRQKLNSFSMFSKRAARLMDRLVFTASWLPRAPLRS